MQIADRLTKIPPYLFMELRKKIAKAKADGVDVISLAIGDPVEPTPDSIIAELCPDGPRSGEPPLSDGRGEGDVRLPRGGRPLVQDPLRRDTGSGDGDPRSHRFQGGLPPLRPGPDQPRRRRPDDRSRLSRLPGEHPHGGRDPLQRPDPSGERLSSRFRGDSRGDPEEGDAGCSSTTRTTRPAPARPGSSSTVSSPSRRRTTSPSATTTPTARSSSTARSG